MGAEVIQLASVKPKTLNKQYKNQRYKLEFLVNENKWRWTVYFVQTLQYSDTEKTLTAAQKAAEKHIEQTIKLRGK